MIIGKEWFLYILECTDAAKSLYIGITTDVVRRLKTHNAGKGARYTKARLPVTLLGFVTCQNHSEALKLEYRLKQFSRLEKFKWCKENLYEGKN